jgi:oligopeptidase B
MKTKEKSGLKRATSSWGKFDKNNYRGTGLGYCARWYKSSISMVYRKDMEKNGKLPLLLYAYGSYGHSMDAYFINEVVALDRGFIYAIAHSRRRRRFRKTMV